MNETGRERFVKRLPYMAAVIGLRLLVWLYHTGHRWMQGMNNGLIPIIAYNYGAQ